MFALCPGLFIQPLTIACGVLRAPDPHARFSPTTQSPLSGMYPVGSTRSTTFLPSGVSWEEKCWLTIWAAIPSAACWSFELDSSFGRPALARSELTRHRIAALIAGRLLDVGVVPASGQASFAPTPFWPLVLWFEFGGIFAVLVVNDEP